LYAPHATQNVWNAQSQQCASGEQRVIRSLTNPARVKVGMAQIVNAVA
jgi:hypothetical protein